MCDRISAWLFESVHLENRLWETDKLGKAGLLVLRIIAIIVLLEINILAIVVYDRVDSLKIFSITSVAYSFSFLTYALLFIVWYIGLKTGGLWKFAHCMFEVFFSFCVGLTVVFWCAIIPVIFSRDELRVTGMRNSWLELSIRIQLHSAIFIIYLIELYTNRIEFQCRHFIVVLLCVVLFVAIYLAVSKLSNYIDDYVNWTDLNSIGFIVAAAALIIGAFFCGVLVTAKKKLRYANEATATKAREIPKTRPDSADRFSLDSV